MAGIAIPDTLAQDCNCKYITKNFEKQSPPPLFFSLFNNFIHIFNICFLVSNETRVLITKIVDNKKGNYGKNSALFN